MRQKGGNEREREREREREGKKQIVISYHLPPFMIPASFLPNLENEHVNTATKIPLPLPIP